VREVVAVREMFDRLERDYEEMQKYVREYRDLHPAPDGKKWMPEINVTGSDAELPPSKITAKWDWILVEA
jgi:hypothetical protein